MHNYNTDKRLADDPATMEAIRAGLAQIGVTVRRTGTQAEDKTGIDLWADTAKQHDVRIDAKIRSHDYGQHDLALETWSIVPDIYHMSGLPGWTVDPRHVSDAVLWHWRDSGRFVLLSYRRLRAVALAHLDEWRRRYKTAQQRNETLGGYNSECVFVPIAELKKYMEVREWTL